MTTPARDSGGHDLGAASDAATPGHTSVAAQFAADAAGLDTPGGATSPGEASPARHRSQEGRPAQDPAGLLHYNSRGRTSGHSGSDAAAARAASGAAAPDAALAAAEPLSKPRLRVQGADIILEDAASPRTTTNGGGATQQQLGEPPAAAAAGGAGPAAQQPALTAQQLEQREQQEQRQLLAQVVQASNQHQQQQHLAALARGSQSHEHELQLRLASRTGTGASNMAIAGSRQVPHADDRWVVAPGMGCMPSADSCRLCARLPIERAASRSLFSLPVPVLPARESCKPTTLPPCYIPLCAAGCAAYTTLAAAATRWAAPPPVPPTTRRRCASSIAAP